MVRLQAEPIRVEALLDAVRGDADGAVALFVGTVRDHNDGHRVVELEYHAYETMAAAELGRIVDEAVRRFGVSRIAVVHRVGRLAIGEASVAVAAASAHRSAAFDACRHVVEALKRTAPIWKKETFEGGAVWIEGPDRVPTGNGD